MGLVYGRAIQVILWLGPGDDVAECLERVSQQDDMEYEPYTFYNSEYWSRAWIAQEFALETRITFMTKDVNRRSWE
jgi:hypothetical protein